MSCKLGFSILFCRFVRGCLHLCISFVDFTLVLFQVWVGLIGLECDLRLGVAVCLC